MILKQDTQQVQQETRSITGYLQELAWKELNRLRKEGQIKKIEEMSENSFIPPTLLRKKNRR